MRDHLRQDPVHPNGAADARHAELQHVYIAQAKEQEAASVPGGDLGRGGRGHDAAAAFARAAVRPLARR